MEVSGRDPQQRVAVDRKQHRQGCEAPELLVTGRKDPLNLLRGDPDLPGVIRGGFRNVHHHLVASGLAVVVCEQALTI